MTGVPAFDPTSVNTPKKMGAVPRRLEIIGTVKCSDVNARYGAEIDRLVPNQRDVKADIARELERRRRLATH
jgi:hypothetical protein